MTHYTKEQIRNIKANFNLNKYMTFAGYVETKKDTKGFLYSRNPKAGKTGSIRVWTDGLRGYNFKDGTKFTNLDFIMNDRNETISQTLDFMISFENINVNNSTKTIKAKPNKKTELCINIIKNEPLTHVALLNYLKGRGISEKTATKYCGQAKFTYGDLISNSYSYLFAVSFENNYGGYELRSKYSKASTENKTMTTILNNNSSVLIFEGFIDFLSYVELLNGKALNKDVIVLNGLGFTEIAISLIKKKEYKRIICFLDSGKGANNAMKKFKDNFNNNTIADARGKYISEKCKDLNDFLRIEYKKIR